MKIGIPKETRPNENRVALSPEGVKQLLKQGWEVYIETDAGKQAGMLNEAYQQAGATVGLLDLSSLDVLLKVNPPTNTEIAGLKPGAASIAFLYAHTDAALVRALNQKQISTFAMDAVPRISRAQKMDALSSQSNLAGYKAVIMGSNALGKIFPLMMTAAGSITPAKVLVFGAGVAGLQAIATAKRLGAVVECTDVRPETKEQVESLGGRFLMVQGSDEVKTEGGYAKEVSADYLQKQKELVSKHVADADLVITTALVMGKKAPVLVTKEMVANMKSGSVIVDMAVESGGNCELSELDKTVEVNGVKVIGQSNIPSLLAVNASELYSRNIVALLTHLAGKEGFKWEMEEEVTKGSLITHQGELVHAFTKQILGQ